MLLTPLLWRLSGARALVSEKEAEEIEFPEDSHPHEIDISCRVWTVDVLKAIPFPVDAMKDVKVLKIDDIIASLETDLGLATLAYVAEFFAKHCPGIEQVDLKDNAIGTRGIEALKPLLTLKLTHLNLKNTGIAEADALTLNQLLPAASLLSLDFSRNSLGDGGAKHFGELLSRCINLQSFAYAGSRALSEGTNALCDGLSSLTNLTYLHLEDCGVGSADLAPCLRGCKMLRHLNLESNGIEIENLNALLDVLANVELEYLNLGGNDFETEGGEVLKKYLEAAPCTLRTLNLGSACLEGEGVAAVLEGLRGRHQLEHLDLSCNQIEATDMFLPPLAGLKTLNVQDNMDLEGFEAVAKAYSETAIDIDEDLFEDADLVAELGNLKLHA